MSVVVASHGGLAPGIPRNFDEAERAVEKARTHLLQEQGDVQSLWGKYLRTIRNQVLTEINEEVVANGVEKVLETLSCSFLRLDQLQGSSLIVSPDTKKLLSGFRTLKKAIYQFYSDTEQYHTSEEDLRHGLWVGIKNLLKGLPEHICDFRANSHLWDFVSELCSLVEVEKNIFRHRSGLLQKEVGQDCLRRCEEQKERISDGMGGISLQNGTFVSSPDFLDYLKFRFFEQEIERAHRKARKMVLSSGSPADRARKFANDAGRVFAEIKPLAFYQGDQNTLAFHEMNSDPLDVFIREFLGQQENYLDCEREVSKESFGLVRMPLALIVRMLEDLPYDENTIFQDCGGGDAKVAHFVHLIAGMKCISVEKYPGYAREAIKTRDRLGFADDQVKLVQKDILETDLSTPDIIYSYTPILDNWLLREFANCLRQEARIRSSQGRKMYVCSAFKLSNILFTFPEFQRIDRGKGDPFTEVSVLENNITTEKE